MPKLVRDLIPQIITKQGKISVTKIIDIEEYKKRTGNKIN